MVVGQIKAGVIHFLHVQQTNNLYNRLLQNRESAFRFRIKRKSEFETLRQIVKDLEDENSALK